MRPLAVGAAGFASAVILGLAGVGVADLATPEQASEERYCEDWGIQLSDTECFTAGRIRFGALINIQGAAQFCKWRPANPGEWNRLKEYAESSTTPQNITTWFGGAIRDTITAYFLTGAPVFTMPLNEAPNVCRTPLAPPTEVGVSAADDTSVTLTWEEPSG
jgi:hypothetical protein